MPAGDMRHLMPNDGCNLVVTLCKANETGVHPDLASGQGKGIGLLVLEDRVLPIVEILEPRRPDDPSPDPLDSAIEFRIAGDPLLSANVAPSGNAHLVQLRFIHQDE